MEKIKPIIFDLKELENKGNSGDGLACYILGRSFDSEENGAIQSYQKALYWYQKGMELNDPRAMYGLGACYYFGDGVEKDLIKAKKLFIEAYKLLLKSIEEDTKCISKTFSIFVLGAYYYFGFGDINVDKEKAFELIYESAMQGHIAGIYDLGANFYYNGVGTEKNLELSKYYLELAASYNLPRAKKKLIEYSKDYQTNGKNF